MLRELPRKAVKVEREVNKFKKNECQQFNSIFKATYTIYDHNISGDAHKYFNKCIFKVQSKKYCNNNKIKILL